jgi:hypothetical protein
MTVILGTTKATQVFNDSTIKAPTRCTRVSSADEAFLLHPRIAALERGRLQAQPHFNWSFSEPCVTSSRIAIDER